MATGEPGARAPGMREAEAAAARAQAPRPRRRWIDLLLFAGILGGVALVGFVPYRLEVGAARHELQRQVLAVGRLKAAAIRHWVQESAENVRVAATGPQVALDVERWVASGRLDPERRRWVAGRLDRMGALSGCLGIAITDPEGGVLLASGGEAARTAPLRSDDVRRAVATNAVVLSPLARPGGRGDPTVVLDAVGPLTAVDARGSRVVGALVFRLDPRAYLFPLIQSWPTDSPSAESLLVERDGGSVRFLNDLRHRKDTAVTMSAPADAPDLVGAKAVRGARGLVEGVDYRGVPVLAWIEPVAGTPWILVSKIDQAEVYAPLRDYLWIYLAFLAVAAVTAGVTTVMRQRVLREASLRREHEGTKRYVEALEQAEAEREALIASLQKALDDVKTLRGIVPICASCKRIRDDEGFWKQVDAYVAEHTEAQFSHGVCPDCFARLYPGLAAEPPEPAKPTP